MKKNNEFGQLPQDQIVQEQNFDSNQQDQLQDNVDTSSMEYNADQIANYEQGYDQSNYNNYYNSYYGDYTQSQVNQDKQMHQEIYAYFIQNYDEMKSRFPKKRRIVRWEVEAENYNSLEATEEFMDIMSEMQRSQEEQVNQYSDAAKEYNDIYDL